MANEEDVVNPGIMEISRGVQPPLEVDFQSVQNLTVVNENNERIRFGDIYQDCRTIVILVRVSGEAELAHSTTGSVLPVALLIAHSGRSCPLGRSARA